MKADFEKWATYEEQKVNRRSNSQGRISGLKSINSSLNSINEAEQVITAQFNQDFSCLAVSTTLGFKVYSLIHPTKLVKLYENRHLGVVSLICMQFRTNILALVTRTERETTDLKSRFASNAISLAGQSQLRLSRHGPGNGEQDDLNSGSL